MSVYTIVLVVHVISAMAMIAAVGALTVCERLLADAASIDAVRMLAETMHRIGTGMKLVAIALLLTGLYMVRARWSIGTPWVIVALLVFVYLAATGPLVGGRRVRAMVAAATAAGSLTPAVRRQLHDPVLVWMGSVRVALFALLVFLMTAKPMPIATLAATLIALGLGVAAARWRLMPAPVVSQTV